MSQVIVIEPNQNLRDLISLQLKGYGSIEVIPRENAQEAQALINILPSIDLIICHGECAGEHTAQLMDNYLIRENLDIPMIILGPIESLYLADKHAHVQDLKEWQVIIDKCVSILGIVRPSSSYTSSPDYVPIPVHYFEHLSFSCCDVFIRIKKDAGEYQFIKRIHAGDSFGSELISKYKEQGLEYFFIPHEMEQNFINTLSDQLILKIADLQKLENLTTESIAQLNAAFALALEQIKSMGFSSATIQLSDAIIQSILTSLERSNKMNELLTKVLNSPSSFLYQHCHLSIIVATEMLKAFKKDSKGNIVVMAYASFFKDIALADHPELAKIGTHEELDKAELDAEKWGLVMNHAAQSAQMIRRHPESPLTVDSLILTHHGSLNGKDFYTEDKDRLGELNIFQQLFILCSDFVRELLLFKEKKDQAPRPIIEVLRERYRDQSIQDILIMMEQTLSLRKSKK